MTVIARGFLSTPFAKAAELLAASTAFQSLVGATNSDEALMFIRYPYADLELADTPIPGAVIGDDDELRQFKKRLGGQGGELLLTILGDLNPIYAESPEDDMKDWRNILGDILGDNLSGSSTGMLANARGTTPSGGSYLHLTGVEKLQIGWLTERDTGAFRGRVGSFKLEWT